MSEKWTTEFSFKFVPLPKEKEEAYWAALHCLAEIMFADLLEENAPKEKDNETQIENK